MNGGSGGQGILEALKALMNNPNSAYPMNGQGMGAPAPAASPAQGPVPGIAGPVQAPLQTEPVAPSTPIPQAAGITDPNAAGENDQKRSLFMEFLLRAGVPLGAAIAGTVNPGIADAAAGLATGYNKGVEYGDDLNAKRQKRLDDLKDDEVAVVDPDHPDAEPSIIRVPHGARVIRKGGKAVTGADFQLDDNGVATLGGQPLDGQAKGDAATQVQERIRVINKEGKEFTVPHGQLEDAKKQGYKPLDG